LIHFYKRLEILKEKMGSSNGKPVLRDEDVATLSKSSGMDEAQVKTAFDNFVTEHPDGKMRPKDFREMMQKAIPGKDAKKMEDHVFRIYDSNNDGYIDFPEFMIIYFIMNEGSPQEVLSRIFRVFDCNNDGTISMKEMKRLIKDMYGMLKSEDPNVATKDFVAKTAFAEMDENQDGKVTSEEFIKACMEKDEFTKMLTLKIIDIFVEDS